MSSRPVSNKFADEDAEVYAHVERRAITSSIGSDWRMTTTSIPNGWYDLDVVVVSRRAEMGNGLIDSHKRVRMRSVHGSCSHELSGLVTRMQNAQTAYCLIHDQSTIEMKRRRWIWSDFQVY